MSGANAFVANNQQNLDNVRPVGAGNDNTQRIQNSVNLKVFVDEIYQQDLNKEREEAQAKYLEFTRRYKADKSSLALFQSQIEFFKQNMIYNVKPSDTITNPHQCGAVARKIYEWRNVVEYANFDDRILSNERRIIDVGASKRLINEEALNVVGLRPTLSFGDLVRQSQTTRYMKNQFVDLTIQQYAKAGRLNRDDLLLFTDSIYYINDYDLYTIADNLNIGVIACGALHVPKRANDTDGYLKCGGKIFGEVQTDTLNNKMTMHVQGNPEIYEHAIRFIGLLDKDVYEITSNAQRTKDFKLYVCALERLDFGATIYTRFRIVKAPVTMTVTQARTLYVPNCPDALSERICGLRKDGDFTQEECTQVLEANGNLKMVNGNKNYVSDGICVIESNGKAVAYKSIQGKIVGKSFNMYAPNRHSTIDTVTNYVNDLRTTFSKITAGSIKADFNLPVESYNRVVKELLKLKELNRDTLKSALFVAQVALPSAGMLDFSVPILASALKEAYQIELHLSSILDSQIATQLNAVKERGTQEIVSESIFFRLARWFLGNNDQDFQKREHVTETSLIDI